jgi:Tfp pilus assembly protein PilN
MGIGTLNVASVILAPLQGGVRWWLGEIAACWSQATAAIRGAPELIVDVSRDSIRVIDGKGRDLTAGSEMPDALEVLEAFGRKRPGARVILRLRPQACFMRTVELPTAARANFGQILKLQIERLTLFKLSEVYAAYYVVGPGPNRTTLTVKHVVTKRTQVDALVERCVQAGLRVAAVDCWNEAGSAGLPLDFLAEGRPGMPKRMRSAMGGVALIAALGAFAGDVMKHEAAINQLAAQTAEVRQQLRQAQATQAARTAAESEALRVYSERIRRPSATECIEEITRLLPDTTVLQQLRIDRNVVEISGNTASAVSLLPLIEQSPLFHEARLTAPVSRDGKDDRERFAIRLQVRIPIDRPATQNKGGN